LDINSIPNFRPLTAIKSWPADPELPGVVRAENSAKPGKDSSNRRQSAAPRDGDFAELNGEAQAETSTPEAETPPEGNINLFA